MAEGLELKIFFPCCLSCSQSVWPLLSTLHPTGYGSQLGIEGSSAFWMTCLDRSRLNVHIDEGWGLVWQSVRYIRNCDLLRSASSLAIYIQRRF